LNGHGNLPGEPRKLMRKIPDIVDEKAAGGNGEIKGMVDKSGL
jgi:hypothetical protein